MAYDDYALMFHGDDERGYHGSFALPGDAEWRHVRNADGELLWRETPHEAEADAGHRLVAELNRRLGHIQASKAAPGRLPSPGELAEDRDGPEPPPPLPERSRGR